MLDNGGLPTFHSVRSYFVSMILADSVSIRDHTVRVYFHDNSHSYRPLLGSLSQYKPNLSLPLA